MANQNSNVAFFTRTAGFVTDLGSHASLQNARVSVRLRFSRGKDGFRCGKPVIRLEIPEMAYAILLLVKGNGGSVCVRDDAFANGDAEVHFGFFWDQNPIETFLTSNRLSSLLTGAREEQGMISAVETLARTIAEGVLADLERKLPGILRELEERHELSCEADSQSPYAGYKGAVLCGGCSPR